MGKVTGLVFLEEKKRGKKNKAELESERTLTDDEPELELEQEDDKALEP